MTDLTDLTAADARDRLADWRTALRAENKAPGTVALYADGTTRYLRWCTEHDHLPMNRASLNTWVACEGTFELGREHRTSAESKDNAEAKVRKVWDQALADPSAVTL